MSRRRVSKPTKTTGVFVEVVGEVGLAFPASEKAMEQGVFASSTRVVLASMATPGDAL
jgi:hypothetical protein